MRRSSLFKQCVGLVILIGVAVAVYLSGRQGWLQSGGSSPSTKASQQPTSGAQPKAGSQAVVTPTYTLEEAKARIRDMLAGNWPDSVTSDNLKRGYFLGTLRGVKPADLPALIAWLNEQPPGPDTPMMIFESYAQLATSQPELALTLIGDIQDSNLRARLLVRVFDTMSANDPRRAYEELQKLPADAVPRATYGRVFFAWAGKNPQEAAAAGESLPTGPMRDLALQSIGMAWGRTDPAAALQWASGLASTNPNLLGTVVMNAAQTNPKLAAEYVDKLSGAVRNDAIWAISSSLVQTDPAAALDWVTQKTTGEVQAKFIKGIFDLLSKPTETFSNNDGYTQMQSAYSANKNISAAVALLDKVSDPAYRESAIDTLAKNWSKTDAKAALAWAQGLPDADGAARAAAVGTIVMAWSKDDPSATLAFLHSQPDPAAFVSFAPAIAENLAKSDPTAALTWVQSLPDGQPKTQATSVALVGLAQTDFPTAWGYAANSLPAGTIRDAAMQNLVGAQAKKDPASTLPLMDQITAGVPRIDATRQVVSTWMQQDPRAATEWVSTLPAGRRRDAAAVQIVASQYTKDPAGAFTWANSIDAPGVRFREVQRVIVPLAGKDAAAARQAIQSANVTDAQRATLLQAINTAQTSGK